MKTIAALTTSFIVTSFATVAYGQAAPTGSAASLEGVRARSVQTNTPAKARTTLESPAASTNPNATRNLNELLGVSDRFELRTGPTAEENGSNVYPNDRSNTDTGVRVLYRLDQQ
jgi:hypothetical protein